MQKKAIFIGKISFHHLYAGTQNCDSILYFTRNIEDTVSWRGEGDWPTGPGPTFWPPVRLIHLMVEPKYSRKRRAPSSEHPMLVLSHKENK